jgi:hypothetical protein
MDNVLLFNHENMKERKHENKPEKVANMGGLGILW